MRLSGLGVKAETLALAAFVAIAITAATVLLSSSTPRTAQATTPCPGADVGAAMCVTDATANVGSNATVTINLYNTGVNIGGYAFDMSYLEGSGLTRQAGTSAGCGGVPANGTTTGIAMGGISPTATGTSPYSAGCTALLPPGTGQTTAVCNGASGCVVATVVVHCDVGALYTLDIASAGSAAYADNTGSLTLIAPANTHNGTVNCTTPPGSTNTPTATNSPTPTNTGTPTATSTPCTNQLGTPVACAPTSTARPFTSTPTPTPTGSPIATNTSAPGTTPGGGTVPTVRGGGAAGAGNIRLPNTGQAAGGSALPMTFWLVVLFSAIAGVTVVGGMCMRRRAARH